MSPEELYKEYNNLKLLRNICVEDLNDIIDEMDKIRVEYKSLTGKEMLIN